MRIIVVVVFCILSLTSRQGLVENTVERIQVYRRRRLRHHHRPEHTRLSAARRLRNRESSLTNCILP